MRINTLLASTALIALCAGTADAAGRGWYLGIEAGWSIINDVDATFHTTYDDFRTQLQADFDSGWAILATAGYAFNGGWRLEGEVGYRNNDLGSIRFRDTWYADHYGSFSPGGTLEEVSLMVNVLYDIYITDRFKLSLGGGIGADWANFEFDNRFNTNNNFNNNNGDGSWAFAYQGIAGLSYALTPRTDLFVNYRYLVVDGADLNNVRDFRDCYEYCYDNRNRFSTDNFNKQTITIGFRYDLYPEVLPPPPPPPPPPPVVVEPPKPRQFIVFFGFNKSNITAEADRIISEAAEAARTFGSASISIVGHTDTVGSPEYNQRLSERRAYAVRGSLASKGIPDQAITTSGRGEMDLMVQTGDGVKEPQNRRATIDLQGN